MTILSIPIQQIVDQVVVRLLEKMRGARGAPMDLFPGEVIERESVGRPE